MSEPLAGSAVENDPCDECGQFGALEIAGRRLCPDCVAVAGCGCAGHDNSEGL